MRVLTALALGLLTATGAHASPLRPADVLASVTRTHPSLEAAAQRVEGAAGKAFGATGAFDPKLSVEAKAMPEGYYSTRTLDASVTQLTPLRGARLNAGYRLGEGRIPGYKGELDTLSGGEIRAGVDIPLWRDGSIDDDRAEIRKTEAKAKAERCRFRETELFVGQKGVAAYWKWVAAGFELRIQRELLAVAEARDRGVREQAAQGSAAPITVTDNTQIIYDRRAKLESARRDFRRASFALSLYLRDADGTPIAPGEKRLPRQLPKLPTAEPSVKEAIALAEKRRPELCAWKNDRAAAGVEVERAENLVGPRLDLQAFVARDIGDGSMEDEITLAPAELGVGIKFELPLRLRKARGGVRAARAKAGALDAWVRGFRDRIAADVRAAHASLTAARKQVEFTRLRLSAAQTLAEAERERFREGGGDLLAVNLRELAAAEAAQLAVDALVSYQLARLEYNAAQGSLNYVK